jgi:WD40 repeat protein
MEDIMLKRIVCCIGLSLILGCAVIESSARTGTPIIEEMITMPTPPTVVITSAEASTKTIKLTPQNYSGNEQITINNANDIVQLAQLTCDCDWIDEITLSSDGTILAMAGGILTHNNDYTRGVVQLWRISDGELLRTFIPEDQGEYESFESVAISPDGSIIAAGGVRGVIYIWQINDGQLIKSFKAYDLYINSMKYSPDGNILATGGGNEAVKIWDASDYEFIKELTKNNNSYPINTVAFSPDGSLLAAGGDNGDIFIFNINEETLLNIIAERLHVRGLVFSPDGRTLAAGYSEDRDIGCIKLRKVNNWDLLLTLDYHYEQIYLQSIESVTYSLDGNIIISGSNGMENNIRLWNTKDGTILKRLDHEGSTIYVIISPDGKTIISSAYLGPIIIWGIK